MREKQSRAAVLPRTRSISDVLRAGQQHPVGQLLPYVKDKRKAMNFEKVVQKLDINTTQFDNYKGIAEKYHLFENTNFQFFANYDQISGYGPLEVRLYDDQIYNPIPGMELKPTTFHIERYTGFVSPSGVCKLNGQNCDSLNLNLGAALRILMRLCQYIKEMKTHHNDGFREECVQKSEEILAIVSATFDEEKHFDALYDTMDWMGREAFLPKNVPDGYIRLRLYGWWMLVGAASRIWGDTEWM